MKNEANTSNFNVQFTVKNFNDDSLPARFKHLMKQCDKPNNTQPPLSSPNKRMQRVLNANGISLNEFGAYQLKVAVPLIFKLKFAKNELHSTRQTSFPTITAELIHHYFKTLKQNSVQKKQREQHRYAIHFFFRLLNQQGYSHVNTRKVLSTSLPMFK